MKRIYEYEDLRPVLEQLLNDKEGTYRRDLDGDYHCSREEVNSMFADANLASPIDGRILKNFSKDDLDADSIKQYRRRFEQWNPDHVWNALPEDMFLEKLNVFRKDRKTGEYGLTYAGLLMFGTYSAIMDENPIFFPDYQEEEQNWKRPYLLEKKRPNKVVLTLSMESLLDESVKEGLSKLYGDKITSIPQEQLLTLALAYSEEEITNERLQYALNMHKADITKMLGQMCTTYLLESSGHGRGTKYHVYGLNDANVGLNDKSSHKKRYSQSELKELIVAFCNDWRTAEEIAFKVGRNTIYVRDRVLPKLSDIIEKMYDIPHHPRQKYRTKQKETDK